MIVKKDNNTQTWRKPQNVEIEFYLLFLFIEKLFISLFFFILHTIYIMGEEAKTFNGKGTYPFQVFTEITFTSVVEVVLREVY